MSVELDWPLLDDALAQSMLAAINRTLAAAKTPSFLGPVVATALDFGADKPDTEVCHIGDVDTLFLDATDRTRAAALAGTMHLEGGGGQAAASTTTSAAAFAARASGRDAMAIAPDAHELHRNGAGYLARGQRGGAGGGGRHRDGAYMNDGAHQQPQLRPHLNGRRGSSYLGSPLGSGSVLGGAGGYASGMRTPSGPGLNHHLTPAWQPQPAIIAAAMRAQALDREAARRMPAPPTRQPSLADMRMRLPISGFPSPLDEVDDPTKVRAPGNTATVAPTLQIHLRTRWRSTTIRCNFQTSLIINYPSPHFMSLDLNLSLVGLFFDGVIVLAIEGEKKKMHISILEHEDDEDDLDDEEEEDEYDVPDVPGPPGDAAANGTPAQPPPKLSRSITALADLALSPSAAQDLELVSPPPPPKPRPLLPPNPNLSPLASRQPLPGGPSEQIPPHRAPAPPPPPLRAQSANAYMSSSSFFSQPIPTTPGARLLPSLAFESSVGDEHRHVLKNVGKVEKFVQDMVRKAVEDQLLFPNFKTVDLRKGNTNKR